MHSVVAERKTRQPAGRKHWLLLRATSKAAVRDAGVGRQAVASNRYLAVHALAMLCMRPTSLTPQLAREAQVLAAVGPQDTGPGQLPEPSKEIWRESCTSCSRWLLLLAPAAVPLLLMICG